MSGRLDPEGRRPHPAPAAEAELTGQAGPTGADNGSSGPRPLPDLPDALLSGYLDAALATLRAADPGDLPGPLRQYQTWTPKRLRHQRVLALVRRTLDLDQSFRKAVDERVLHEEEALARLLRAGRHAEALASGETPEAVARVGLALGPDGEAAVQAAVAAAATSQARAEAAAVRSALAGAENELDAAREKAVNEAAAAKAAREELRAAKGELRRVERERRTLADRVEGLERELAQSAAAVRASRDEAAAELRRLNGRIAELQARLTESQRNYRTLRRSSGQVDPAVLEAVGALERDLDTLRRVTGVGEESGRGRGGPAGRGHPEPRNAAGETTSTGNTGGGTASTGNAAPGTAAPGTTGGGNAGGGTVGGGTASTGSAAGGTVGGVTAGSGNAGGGNAGSGYAGPGNAGRASVGRGNAGPGYAGPGTTGPGNAGPGTTGPGNAGPGAAGPGSGGPGRGGPGTAGRGRSGRRSGGPGNARRGDRRRQLPVPGGRGADDPETLATWMGADGVLVLVDGYNVTKHPQGFADRGLEDQRTLLLDLCRRLARRFGAETTVVFDGGTVGPIPTRLPLGPVEVVFTDAGRTADDEIVVRTNAAPPDRPVVVVTSDNELRTRVSALGATVTRSPALLGLAAAR